MRMKSESWEHICNFTQKDTEYYKKKITFLPSPIAIFGKTKWKDVFFRCKYRWGTLKIKSPFYENGVRILGLREVIMRIQLQFYKNKVLRKDLNKNKPEVRKSSLFYIPKTFKNKVIRLGKKLNKTFTQSPLCIYVFLLYRHNKIQGEQVKWLLPDQRERQEEQSEGRGEKVGVDRRTASLLRPKDTKHTHVHKCMRPGQQRSKVSIFFFLSELKSCQFVSYLIYSSMYSKGSGGSGSCSSSSILGPWAETGSTSSSSSSLVSFMMMMPPVCS